jgi:hypothetical protein
MYPMNRPNIHNQPKQRDRFSLKEGKYFWLSSIMKTYNKEKQAAWQEEMKKREKQVAEETNDNIN